MPSACPVRLCAERKQSPCHFCRSFGINELSESMQIFFVCRAPESLNSRHCCAVAVQRWNSGVDSDLTCHTKFKLTISRPSFRLCYGHTLSIADIWQRRHSQRLSRPVSAGGNRTDSRLSYSTNITHAIRYNGLRLVAKPFGAGVARSILALTRSQSTSISGVQELQLR